MAYHRQSNQSTTLYVRMHPLEPLLKDAILSRKRIVATYAGLRREMCPHIIGAKGDKLHCLFYQYGGESSRGLGPPGSPDNWRCLPLAGLHDVEVREGEWFSASNYTTVQSCIDTIETMTVMDIGESG